MMSFGRAIIIMQPVKLLLVKSQRGFPHSSVGKESTCNAGDLGSIPIPDHLSCLLRDLYAGQEVTVRTGHGTTDWFQIGKGVRLGCILSPCLFNLYAEYIMRNAGLEETQAGTKIAGRNINMHMQICK